MAEQHGSEGKTVPEQEAEFGKQRHLSSPFEAHIQDHSHYYWLACVTTKY